MAKEETNRSDDPKEQALLEGVTGLPRDALQLLFRMEKNSAEKKMLHVQDQVLRRLRKQYGDFDESSLVYFLVKYLLKQEGVETSPGLSGLTGPGSQPH